MIIFIIIWKTIIGDTRMQYYIYCYEIYVLVESKKYFIYHNMPTLPMLNSDNVDVLTKHWKNYAWSE